MKLQGWKRESNWNFKIPSQASVTAPEDPGKANIYFPLHIIPCARYWIVEVPIVL